MTSHQIISLLGKAFPAHPAHVVIGTYSFISRLRYYEIDAMHGRSLKERKAYLTYAYLSTLHALVACSCIDVETQESGETPRFCHTAG